MGTTSLEDVACRQSLNKVVLTEAPVQRLPSARNIVPWERRRHGQSRPASPTLPWSSRRTDSAPPRPALHSHSSSIPYRPPQCNGLASGAGCARHLPDLPREQQPGGPAPRAQSSGRTYQAGSLGPGAVLLLPLVFHVCISLRWF